MRFTHTDVNFDIKYDSDQNPQNVHRKYFWPILVSFKFDIKFDVNISQENHKSQNSQKIFW